MTSRAVVTLQQTVCCVKQALPLRHLGGIAFCPLLWRDSQRPDHPVEVHLHLARQVTQFPKVSEEDSPDTHAVLLGLLDRLTASHLRFLTMWDNPRAGFALHRLPEPRAGMAGSRTQAVDAGLPEMRGRTDFITMLSNA